MAKKRIDYSKDKFLLFTTLLIVFTVMSAVADSLFAIYFIPLFFSVIVTIFQKTFMAVLIQIITFVFILAHVWIAKTPLTSSSTLSCLGPCYGEGFVENVTRLFSLLLIPIVIYLAIGIFKKDS